jgi:mannitol operon transcriptional antiterminator
MDLTKRQGSILELLLRGERDTTIGSIAARVGVSPRTVHRELARIAAPLRRDFGLALSARSGHGIVLVGSAERLAECRADLAASVPKDLDAEDRRRMLAVSLLDAGDAVKTFALASEIGETALQVRHDLEHLRPWLEIHGLLLILRRGFGVTVAGEEERKREALRSLIMEQFGEAGILALIRDERIEDSCPDEPVVHLFNHFPPERFREAEAALSSLAKGILPPLAPRDYLGLVCHLAIATERCRRGRPAAGSLNDNDGAAEAEFDAAGAAREIAAAAAARYPGMASPAEVRAVERFLRGAKLERPAEDLLESGVGSITQVRALIEACGRNLDRDFRDDRTLRDGLAAHWGPAHYRLRNRLPIRNPILEQIKARYAELFEAASAACRVVFPDLSVPEDEIGYLVLHFGSSIERAGRGIEKFRALVVCSAGIGSARMLASRIRAELPEIDIVANLSWFDVKDAARERWDLLISTIPLPLPPEEYVLVDPLLSPDGLDALRRHMVQRRSRLADAAASAPAIRREGPFMEGPIADSPSVKGTLGELKQMSRHLSAAIAVLERLRVFADADAGETWEELLRGAVGRCAGSGLADDAEATLRDLRERSRDRGILLPGSRILFLHARSAGVSAPSLSLHAFSSAYPVRENRWEARPKRLALMLAPRALDRETQDILNEISVSLLDARTVEVLHSADEAAIRAHFSRYLDRYFRSVPLQGA